MTTEQNMEGEQQAREKHAEQARSNKPCEKSCKKKKECIEESRKNVFRVMKTMKKNTHRSAFELGSHENDTMKTRRFVDIHRRFVFFSCTFRVVCKKNVFS